MAPDLEEPDERADHADPPAETSSRPTASTPAGQPSSTHEPPSDAVNPVKKHLPSSPWLPPLGFVAVAATGAWWGPTAALVAALGLLAVAGAVVGHTTKSGAMTLAAFALPTVALVAVYAFARWPTSPPEHLDLGGANLRGTDLQNASLRDADLSGADFTGACLAGADLRGSILTDARFTDADVRGAQVDADARETAIDWPQAGPVDSPCGPTDR